MRMFQQASRTCFVAEAMEPRQMLSASPTANEQYLLELINRIRMAPSQAQSLYGVDLNEGPPDQTIAATPKQPLAFNASLISSARTHSQDMLDHDYFAHAGSDASQPHGRMASAGYAFGTQGWASGENIAWSGQTPGTPNVTDTTTSLDHELFVDSQIAGRGHRENVMNPAYKEIGIGTLSGDFVSGGKHYNSVMITEDFAYAGPGVFMTGVAYTDQVKNDNFYTPGEGLGGVTITAQRQSDNASFTTTTFGSGGYTLPLAAGTYTLTASGGGLNSPIMRSNVVVGSSNVKMDFIPGGSGSGGNADVAAPTAVLKAAKVSRAGAKAYTLKVTYSDGTAVRAASLATGNVVVTSSRGFSYTAKLVGRTSASDAGVITATYRIVPPGGSWNVVDNGTYTVSLRGKQVADSLGQFVAARRLGTFAVAIPRA